MEKRERTQLNCETTSTVDFLTEKLGIKTYSPKSVIGKIILVHFHIINRNDGTGGLTNIEVDQVLENLQLAMEQASICIVEKDRSNINNSTFYSSNPSTTFSNIVATNRQSEAINLYLFPTSGLDFGRADEIPSNALVVSGSYVLTGVTTHEFGHCLGLFHTHRGTYYEGGGGPNQCPELVNGSNSAICGDYITDTPADPNMWSGCTYIGTGTDANGQTYSPLTNNIISYVSPSCLQKFTPMQIARIHTAIDNSPVLQNTKAKISGPSTLCDSEIYTLNNLPSGTIVVGWSALPFGSVSFSGNGNSVTVIRSSNFNSGEVIINATVSTSCGNINIVRTIWVGVPDMPVYYDELGIPIFHIDSCIDLHHNVSMKTEAPSNFLQWDWEVIIGDFNAIDLGGGAGTIIGFQPTSGFFSVKAGNECGWSLPALITVNIKDCSTPNLPSDFHIYPDPANNLLTIKKVNKIEYQHQSNLSLFYVILYDSKGHQLQQNNSKDGVIHIDTITLSGGVYFLCIQDGNHLEYRRMIIQH